MLGSADYRSADVQYYNYIQCHQIYDNWDFLVDQHILNMKGLIINTYHESNLSILIVKLTPKKTFKKIINIINMHNNFGSKMAFYPNKVFFGKNINLNFL